MRKLLAILAGLVLLTTQVYAQNRTVTGKVTDETGNPLAGVTITATGIAKNAISDAKGNYSIQVSDKNPSLKFFYSYQNF